MSTDVEMRSPMAEVAAAVADLGTAGSGPLDAGAAAPAEVLAAAYSPPARLPGLLPGLRSSSSIETMVRLGSDAVALSVAGAVIRPTVALSVLWAVMILVSFAAAGLYGRRLRLSTLDDVPAILVGSVVGLVAMSLAHGPELSRTVLGAALAFFLVVLARGGAYLVI